MKKNKVNLQEIARYVMRALLADGFKIQYYEAFGTNSLYIKLDYGVCNSIRISDHEGKGYLSYRYNIRTDISKYFVKYDRKGLVKLFYPLDKVDGLIHDINIAKASKLMQYGGKKYGKYMEEARESNKSNKGFWSKSKEIDKI